MTHEAIGRSRSAAPSTAQKFRQQSAGVRFERFCDLDEFDNVQPALAALVFGDEGLLTAQPFGNIRLGELLGFPNAREQFLQSLLPCVRSVLDMRTGFFFGRFFQ